MNPQEAAATIAGRKWWYHTIEIAPGVVTPGFWDHRSAAAAIPWPDLNGMRCLDVGTFDGFWAYEMERRGGDVVALELLDPTQMDWPFDFEAEKRKLSDQNWRRGSGFRIAHEVLESKVELADLNVYDLSPERLGMFDVVFLGHILEHLENPIGALEAVRSVCRGWVIVYDQLRTGLSLLHPRKAVARVAMVGKGAEYWNWFAFNRRGLEQIVRVTGFDVESVSGRLKDHVGAGAPEHWWTRPLKRRLQHAVGLNGVSIAIRGRVREAPPA